MKQYHVNTAKERDNGMNKKEILDDYLKKYKVPNIIVKKINIKSFLTDNFAYEAFRIGNAIGDIMDIPIEIILLEEIAKKQGLILDTTEHAELHTRGSTEKDLDKLIKGALLFENVRNNKKRYKQALKSITDHIREEVKTIIESVARG
ncbi:MAG: hypothetical protein GY754_42295 [bacterium]|nr:hypothetical protein [bacterium]